MNPKISVIVPVYNTSKYLKQCLDSLINQTFNNFEIICVDDGSTDDSLKILQGYADIDQRIRIITQENYGQSVARNRGLDVAQGQYVAFLDSDDYATPNMLQELYSNIQRFNSDVAMCSINVFDERTGVLSSDDPYLGVSVFDESFDLKIFSYEDCLNFLFRICVVPWNKLYRASFLKKNNIKFVENLNFEDNVFTLKILLKAKMSLVRNPLVVYRRASETSYSYNDDNKKLDFFEVMDELEKVLISENVYVLFEEYFNRHKRNTLAYWYKKIKCDKVKKTYEKRLFDMYKERIVSEVYRL